MGESQQKEKEGLCPGLSCSKGDDFGSIVESGNQQGRRKIDEHPDDFRADDGTYHSEGCALLGSVIFTRTQILADEGGKSHGEAGDRQKAEALYLGVGAAAGDSHLSELVDICLDEYIGNGDDGILEAGGQTVT